MRSLVHVYPQMRKTYYKRRFAAVTAVAFVIWAFVQIINPTSTYKCDGVDHVVARPGDNLTVIAQQHCTGDIQAVVEDMIGLNRGSFIKIGQIVYLPGK